MIVEKEVAIIITPTMKTSCVTRFELKLHFAPVNVHKNIASF